MADDAAAVARGAGVNLVGMLARLLHPLFLFVAAGLYGSTSFGVYMLAWAVIDVCGKAATFGVDKGVMRFLPIADNVDALLSSCLRIAIVGAGASSLLLMIAAGPIARFYRIPEIREVMMLLAPTVTTTAVVTTLITALMAAQIMRGQILVRGILEPLVVTVACVGFRFAFGRAAWALALSQVLAGICAVAAASVLFARRFSLRRTVAGIFRTRSARGLVRFSLPMWASDGLAALQSRADLLTFARLLPDPRAVGMYAVAKQIANVVNVVRFSFDPVFWPRVSAFAQRGDRAALEAVYRLVARWVAWLALPAALVLARFGPDIGHLVGRDYRGPLAVFGLLCVGQLFNAVFGLAGHLMAMAGRPSVVVWGYAWGTLLMVALAAVLTPRWGMTGAAAASALSYVAVMSYQVVLAWRVHAVSPLSAGFGKVLVAAAVMALAVLVAARVLGPALAVAAGFVLYAAVYWLLGPAPEDLALWARVRRSSR
jgi:O-antigen/teichoic acid export membrane protein